MVFEARWTIDLKDGTMVDKFPYTLVQGDTKAHRIRITLTDGVDPPDMHELEPSCYAIIEKRGTVALPSFIRGNDIVADLTPTCYHYAGDIRFLVRVMTLEGQKITLLVAHGMVQKGDTWGYLNPCHKMWHGPKYIPGWEEVLAAERLRKKLEWEREINEIQRIEEFDKMQQRFENIASGKDELFVAASVSGFPAIGDTNMLYKATEERRLYQWDERYQRYEMLCDLPKVAQIHGGDSDPTDDPVLWDGGGAYV